MMFETVLEKARAVMGRAKESAGSLVARAHSMMDHAIDSTGALIAVAIGIGAIAAGIFFTVNTSSWDTTSQLVWPYIFVLAIVVIIFGYLKSARKGE